MTMFAEFDSAARWLHGRDVRAVVLTGTGHRAFCPGFDLAEIDVLSRMLSGGL